MAAEGREAAMDEDGRKLELRCDGSWAGWGSKVEGGGGGEAEGGEQGERRDGVSAGVPQDCSRRERKLTAEVVACDAGTDGERASESSEAASAALSSDTGEEVEALKGSSSCSGMAASQTRRRL